MTMFARKGRFEIDQRMHLAVRKFCVRARKFMRPLYTYKRGSVRRVKGTATIAIICDPAMGSL